MSKTSQIEITVSPKSSRSCIVISDDNSIKVYLNSPPVDGKANRELITLFAKYLKIARSKIVIEKGSKGKKKKISIEGYSRDEIYDALKKSGI